MRISLPYKEFSFLDGFSTGFRAFSSVLSFFFFFLMWSIFKVFIEFVTIFLPFFPLFWFFDHKVCGILTLQPGIESTSPALEGEVPIIELQGKPLFCPSSLLLGKLKWRNSCSGFRDKKAEQPLTLLLTCLDTVLTTCLLWVQATWHHRLDRGQILELLSPWRGSGDPCWA